MLKLHLLLGLYNIYVDIKCVRKKIEISSFRALLYFLKSHNRACM